MRKIVLLNILRHKVKSIGIILISLILSMCLCIYMKNIKQNEEQLKEIAKIMPITVQITNQAGAAADIRISDKMVHRLEELPYADEGKSGTELYVRYGEDLEIRDLFQYDTILKGANSYEAVVLSELLEKEEITFLEGWEDSFFSSSEKICIVSEEVLKERGLEIGGDLEITLFDKDAAKNRIRCIGCQKFKIVGSFPDADQKSAEKIICPLNCLRGIFERNQMDLYRSHATVILENPLKLNAFKGYAKEVGFTEIQPTEKESIYGNSIIMYDKTFMDAATPIRHNILLGEKMFPIFLFLIMMIGVLISVLSIHNRKSEIFIYRLLGVRGKEVVAAIVREIGFLCICGLTGNMAVSRAILLMEGKMILAVSGLYFICYLLGSIVTTSIYTHRNLLND